MRTRVTALLPVLLLVLGCPESKKKQPPPPSAEPAQPAPTADPVVIEVRGEVTQDGRALAQGDRVSFDQEIVVGDGRATIELPDGATLRLYPHTRLRLPSKEKVRLSIGKLWAVIAHRFEDHFEVETANAVAGIRGTELIVEATERQTRVAVVTGEVEVANLKKRNAPRRVRKGEEVVVRAEEAPTEPAAFVPAAEEKTWKELGEKLPPTVGDEPSPADRLKRTRPRNRLEREGDETKRRLIEEGKKTEGRLKKEDAATERRLHEEEAETRRKFKDDARRAKEGSVKDFLD